MTVFGVCGQPKADFTIRGTGHPPFLSTSLTTKDGFMTALDLYSHKKQNKWAVD